MFFSTFSSRSICVGVNYSSIDVVAKVKDGNLIDEALDQFRDKYHVSLTQRLHNNCCFYDETYLFGTLKHAQLFIKEMETHVPHLNFLFAIGRIYSDD
jgi:hypothetical protein